MNKQDICPKCFKPYWNDKLTTDGELCNCNADWDSGHAVIKPAINDKLKEIRDKKENRPYTFKNELTEMVDKKIKKIQSETYQLGRQEVIDEIEKWADEQLNMSSRYYSRLISKLGSLKEE